MPAETSHNPLEHNLDRMDVNCLEVKEKLRLIALEETIEENTKGQDTLLVGADLMQMIEVAQVECPEREIESNDVIIQIAEWCGIHGESMEWDDATRRIYHQVLGV